MLQSPVSSTISVRCSTLNVANNVVLLGDAAHAMSASVGQGCNSALQDVSVLSNILDQNNNDWSDSLEQYTIDRMPDVQAVSDLSQYSVPRTRLMKIEWILRTILGKILPKRLAKMLLSPLPMELPMETDHPYREVYERTKWWTERVRRAGVVVRKHDETEP